MYEVIGKVTHPYGWECVVVVTGQFPTGLYRVDLFDEETGEPVGQVGKNLEVRYLDSWLADHPNGRYTFLKDNSEMQGMLSRLAGAGLVETTGIVAPSGFIEMHLVEIKTQEK